MKLLLKISIITVISIFGISSHAQIPTSIDGVTIDTSVSNPRPGQAIEVYLESFSFDLNSSSIVWTVDGKVYSQGIGVKKIDIVAPKIGTRLNVVATIKGPDGREIRKNLTIKTASIDIIWESDGYVPPFFKGKIPFSYQNSIKLIAIPHMAQDATKEIDPKTLVYSWKMGGKYIENGQGYGKQSVTVEAGDIPKPLEISVEVSNREQTQYTIGYMTLTPTEPSLAFYEEDSLYGILFNKSLTERVSLKNSEMKILAIPFGFNLNGGGNNYTWSINNVEQPDLLKNRSITIRTKGDTEGSSSVDLDIRNENNILQGARGGFSVYFTKKQIEEENVTF